MKATSHGEGFYHSLEIMFFEKTYQNFFSHDNNNTNENSDDNIALFRILK